MEDIIDDKCFIAGTMIETIDGTKPIEEIEIGDLVLSAQEVTGQVAYNRVIQTFDSRTKEIWRILYDHDGDPQTPAENLFTTGGHQIWEAGERCFQSAAEFDDADSLVTASGMTVEVIAADQLNLEVPISVYNFAVANHHTYFAGKGGVWVHNDCTDLREEIILTWADIIVRERGSSGSGGNTRFDPDIYDQAQEEALGMLRDNLTTYTHAQRTMTGAVLFEGNPRVINADVEEDAGIVQEFIDQTGLQANTGIPLPISVARKGDGFQPYFGAPKTWSPKCWQEMSNELEGNIAEPHLFDGYTIPLVRRAKKSSDHCEAKSILRLLENEGSAVVVNVTTVGKPVCDNCVNRDGSGIGLYLHVMRHEHGEIDKLNIFCEEGFSGLLNGNNVNHYIFEYNEGDDRVEEGIGD